MRTAPESHTAVRPTSSSEHAIPALLELTPDDLGQVFGILWQETYTQRALWYPLPEALATLPEPHSGVLSISSLFCRKREPSDLVSEGSVALAIPFEPDPSLGECLEQHRE